eukprot:TRINITY_DN20895_c0_g1_i1.p1 TRINITY_DN20895_c0_g1~~TRINITY_DN20895_c0_g1_i1.p1  ORF type:complete len:234 (-),score=52.04 TRINITY_DN20895_c0_g1_i1:120-821(-)
MAKRKVESMKDVEIVVAGDESIMANSYVLAAASPVFENMLASGMVESRTKKIKLADKTKEAMQMLLDLIQPVSGRFVKLTPDNIEMVLPLLNEYQVEGLEEECENAMLASPATAERLAMAKRFGLSKAASKLRDELVQRFPDVDVAPMTVFPEVTNEFLSELKISLTTKAALKLETKKALARLSLAIFDVLPGTTKLTETVTVDFPGKRLVLSKGARADEAIRTAIGQVAILL